MSKLLIVVFSLISACVGQIVQPNSQCDPTIASTVTNFVPGNFAGSWYDIESLEPTPTAVIGTCHIHSWTVSPTGFNVRNSEVVDQTLQSVTGTAVPTTGQIAGTPKYTVTITNSAGVTVSTWEYTILGTDYNTFALVYACRNVGTSREVNLWKLGRNTGSLPPVAAQTIQGIIDGSALLNTLPANLVVRSHTADSCYASIELPGSCPDASGVPNFNVNSFLGTWEEYSRYPNNVQTGQCSRAEYTLGATVGVVNVVNTEILPGNLLTTTTGTATAHPTLSGVLQVLLNVPGGSVSSDLYVLATDYENFALVYSCTPTTDGRRRISSWQLRKTNTQLDDTQNLAINNAIDAVDGLDRVYFQETSRTSDACIHYPDLPPLSNTVELRGPCADIGGFAGFNLNTFLGTWHEVARYPSETQTGQCSRAEYATGATAGVVSITNTDVTAGALSTILGTATATPQNGVLEVQLNVEGTPRTSTLHVLATDNTDYALVYSCVNVPGNNRRVTSWKLSKSGEPLTAAANAAIDEAISTTNGLDNRYYQETSRTSDACIHYPDLPPLSNTVELRGPCADIGGFAGFNLNTFLGTWHEVARYPSETQTGQCSRAEYATGATAGVVSITNTDVNAGVLSTILGTATATNQNGVLEVQLNVEGTISTSTLHVLATDNTGYALVYSCVNVPGNNRRVTSWKLSKSGEPLTAAANAAIDEAISTTNGLDNRYYQETSRTSDACIHYPDLPPLSNTVELRGPCADIGGFAGFDLNSFLGTWYEVARYPSEAQTGQCSRAEYATGATAGVVSITNTEVTDLALSTILGTATATSQNGVLQVELNVEGTIRSTTLHVLATDNAGYALVYSCVNVPGNNRRVTSWKLSRSTEPLTAIANAAIDNAISATNGLDNKYYQETSQSDAACFYYPEYDTLPDTIEFPGACPTISGLANFDLPAFLGTWHEVARYPYESQTGQCSRATYALGATAGVVSIENSEVTAGVLSTILGTATATAQPGVLQVQLDGVPGSTILHVLATDYDNYALVYSCDTIEGNRRRVTSWKLSKNGGPLTAAANAAIDDVIAATEGLDNRYYQETSQTSDACIHYPDLPPLSNTVELRGPCADIGGFAGFNLNTFLGTWHEVARYPSETQTGQCSRAEYATGATAGVVSITNTDVNAGVLSTILGTATATSQNGVLQVQLNVEGTPRTSTLHVLTTDNTGYALVYSCVNVPGNNRRVTSWKLSKSGEPLTAAANAAIDEAISTTNGLDNRYYQETSRTSDACIHYPDLPPLSNTVELRGPCADIGGFAGFNLNTFLGTWYEVARYPSEAQTGQCSRAEYATGAAGVVSITNTEVTDLALSTILGTATATSQNGVLQVELNVEGTIRPTTLHVLATDNTGYALVYSCVNVPGNNRRVTSWKLSRSTEPLTAIANAAIDNAISATNGLDNKYYQETSQSDAACFYYPEYDTLPDTIEFRGACPTISGLANFDLPAFLGTWHEVARYPYEAQTGQCSRATYTIGATGVVSIENSEVIAGALSTILGTATATAQPGVLQVQLDGVPGSTILHVLATDYENYALVYSCDTIEGNRRRVTSWKLSKNGGPLTAAANAAIDDVIAATEGLDNRYYQETSQTSDACIHYPDLLPLSNSVELRGPCANIGGIQDFTLSVFLGKWYEVARYPNEDQTGQCNRAEYSWLNTGATNDEVSIRNTEVNDLALSTILGTARPTSQSGVLQVELNVAGTIRSTTLHVLASDLVSYALVYSCINLPGNNRRVTSWKLSKNTEPLTAEANVAIDNAISATNGLDNKYYQETSQSDAACFFYPEYVTPPESIVLRGACPTTISGVANFNLNAFLGTWHEVARYPHLTQTGQCNRAVYGPGASTGSISVENTHVNNEALTTLSGQGTLVNENGHLQLLFNNGGNTPVDIHILATDYTSYALVYSCDTITGNRRRVSSWKLSKNGGPLTAAANAAMDVVITATEGLDNRYYQETSQSNAACFYYPEFVTPPSTIELPGPCPAITPVANFDLSRYLGTWYEVARYPQIAQTGQCNRAVYQTVEDGVSVVNSQVTGEVLQTISGEARPTNQPGVLEVLLNVGDDIRTTNLHVLATDYTNYALVYSCVDIEGNRRRVGSWKLSRDTSPLLEEANVAMDAVISETQGLNEDYYQPTSQSDAACFHYPTQTGENVIIPGKCDQTISGVTNIDLDRFTNELVWYQIKRYDAVVGTCIGTRLKLEEDYIHINHIERFGDEVKRLSGVARLSSAPDGKFTFEMEDSEDQKEIYIMATDYDEYAIAYNCKDVGTNERQVGVWLLSRERTLPEAATNALDQLIATRQEFTNRPTYLKEILHPNPSGDECPEPSSGYLFKSSIIMLCVCALLQLVW